MTEQQTKITKRYNFFRGEESLEEDAKEAFEKEILAKKNGLRRILSNKKNEEGVFKKVLCAQAGEIYELWDATSFFGSLAEDAYVKITGYFKGIEKAKKYLEREGDFVLQELNGEKENNGR
jgi:hypothetical protein